MRRRKIEGISSAVVTLERRADYLKQRLGMSGDRYRRERDFDQREHEAIQTAIDAMRFAQLIQRDGSDALDAIERLVDASDLILDAEGADPGTEALGELADARETGNKVLVLADAFLNAEGSA